MTQGFDEWFDAYKAGAASRQADIDELKRELEILQGMHNAVSLTAGDLVDERDELKKRINKSLKVFEESNLSSLEQIEKVYGILKGEQDEN